MPNTHRAIIAGGGPTGLMLAGELRLQGVEALIIERRPSQALAGRRAGGLHARTLEILDQRGIAETFVDAGQKAQTAGFAGVHFDLSGFPTRFAYGIGLWQVHIERILAAWVAGLGVETLRGTEVTGVTQDDAGVEVGLSDGRALRGDYLVGCDGGRSLVRKAAGFAFPGTEPTTSNIIAEVEMTELPPFGVHRTALGIHSFGRAEYRIVDGTIVYAESGPIGVMVTETTTGATGEPTLKELRAGLIAATGTDYGLTSASWISRFTDAARQATTYRMGRVLIAGDAAHIHPPDGGQGLQLGVQDAVNLGWKLAQVAKEMSPVTLLDTYTAERHPVAARVLRLTQASSLLRRDDERTRALRGIVDDLLRMDAPGTVFAAMMSGLDIAYDLGGGHPLVGRRMPDLDLWVDGGPTRVHALMHEGRPLLLSLGGRIEMGAWAARVRLVEAATTDAWVLPVIGAVAAPSAVLVRPDGHVAWVGMGSSAGLEAALTRWFGAA